MFFRIKYSSSKQKLNETRLINHSLFFLILNLFTLSLGGWWALQEGSWGGWWNWDPSETFGLMVMLFYVITLHLNIIKLRNKWYRVYIYLFFCTIILLYTLIQLNFDLVSHNFGTRLHQFVNSYYTHCYILALLYLQLSTLLFKQGIYLNQSKININLLFTSVVLNILILFILLSAFLDLIINFIWVLFTTNMFNFNYVRTDLIMGLCFTFTLAYYISNTFYYIPLILIVINGWVFKLILISIIFIIKLLNFHKLSLSWLYLTVFYINQSIANWVLLKSTPYTHYINLKLNVAYTEIINLLTKNNYSSEIAWGFLKNTTSCSSLLFTHSLNTNAFAQELKSPSFDLVYSIAAIESSTSTTALLLLFLFLHFIKTFNYRPIIKF
jgi:cytochrome c biogenesis factor